MVTREGREGQVSEEPVTTAAVSAFGIFRGRRKGHAVKNLAGALPAEAVRCTLIGRLGSQNGNSELDVQAKRPNYRGVLRVDS